MDEETQAALVGSIEKWEKIVAGTGEDKGATNCPLCQKFMFVAMGKVPCIGCPVQQRTNEIYCTGTPYDKWKEYIRQPYLYNSTINFKKLKELAQDEVEFLKSLLPQ